MPRAPRNLLPLHTLGAPRKRAGMTQAEVAKVIGTHPKIYGRMERDP